MKNMFMKAGLGVALAATSLTVAAPAEAQRYRRYDRGGDVATGAIIGGVVGLGLGAAIASSNRDRYYDRRFYGRRGFYDDRFYRRGPRFRGGYYPPRRAFRRGYYAPRGYYGRRGFAPGYGYGYGY